MKQSLKTEKKKKYYGNFSKEISSLLTYLLRFANDLSLSENKIIILLYHPLQFYVWPYIADLQQWHWLFRRKPKGWYLPLSCQRKEKEKNKKLICDKKLVSSIHHHINKNWGKWDIYFHWWHSHTSLHHIFGFDACGSIDGIKFRLIN